MIKKFSYFSKFNAFIKLFNNWARSKFVWPNKSSGGFSVIPNPTSKQHRERYVL